MNRGIIEINFNPNGVKYYSVIDTMFDKLVMHTSSTHLANHVAKCVNVCKHETPYDYMLHSHKAVTKSD
jgi:hypothetical protein